MLDAQYKRLVAQAQQMARFQTASPSARAANQISSISGNPL